MKTQTFKSGNELIMRITLNGAEIDRQVISLISLMGPGIARAANATNTKPLFGTKDMTYELRLPCELDDAPEIATPPSAVSG